MTSVRPLAAASSGARDDAAPTDGSGNRSKHRSTHRPKNRNPPKTETPQVPWGVSYIQARRTGIEPATTGVTSRYSNQLSYRPNTPRSPARDGESSRSLWLVKQLGSPGKAAFAGGSVCDGARSCSQTCEGWQWAHTSDQRRPVADETSSGTLSSIAPRMTSARSSPTACASPSGASTRSSSWI